MDATAQAANDMATAPSGVAAAAERADRAPARGGRHVANKRVDFRTARAFKAAVDDEQVSPF